MTPTTVLTLGGEYSYIQTDGNPFLAGIVPIDTTGRALRLSPTDYISPTIVKGADWAFANQGEGVAFLTVDSALTSQLHLTSGTSFFRRALDLHYPEQRADARGGLFPARRLRRASRTTA